MFSLRSIFRALVATSPAAVNDNHTLDDTTAVPCNSECAVGRRFDPYLCDAVEARRLMVSARLISAVDGSSSSVLNVMSTRRRRAA